jgi:hypothetical protein
VEGRLRWWLWIRRGYFRLISRSVDYTLTKFKSKSKINFKEILDLS